MVLRISLIILVLLFIDHWVLTISFMLGSIPILATILYKPIISPTFLSLILITDKLRVTLVMLTFWVCGLALVSRTYILHAGYKARLYLRLVIRLWIILTLAFLVSSLLTFYILFEAALIPILIIIILWGRRPERLYAGIYIIIYTISASLPLLFLLLLLKKDHGRLFYIREYPSIGASTLFFISLAFLVKFPIYGVHTWLPKAHVEAPVGGSILLAGVLLKLGPYGIMRFIIIFPAYGELIPLFTTWGILGRLAAGIICIRQTDIKSLVAYASVSHIGLVLAALITYTNLGWWGARLILIGHGLARSGLFALVGAVYEWTHSRSLIVNRGLIHIAPGLGFFFFLLVAFNIGVPPSLNIGAEVFIIRSLVVVEDPEVPIIYVILILFSVVSILYRLALYTSLYHGEVSPSFNYFWTRPIYYTIRLLHIIPLVIGFFVIPVFL